MILSPRSPSVTFHGLSREVAMISHGPGYFFLLAITEVYKLLYYFNTRLHEAFNDQIKLSFL